jgi:hypothetical protein
MPLRVEEGKAVPPYSFMILPSCSPQPWGYSGCGRDILGGRAIFRNLSPVSITRNGVPRYRALGPHGPGHPKQPVAQEGV